MVELDALLGNAVQVWRLVDASAVASDGFGSVVITVVVSSWS